MPASPDLGATAAALVLRVYTDAETTLLAMLADRLAKGLDGAGWEENKLTEIRALRADAQRAADRLNVTGLAAVRQAIADAYAAGVKAAMRELRALGMRLGVLPTPALPVSIGAAFGVGTNTAAVEALARAAVDAVAGTHTRITREVVDVYQRVTTVTAAQTVAGVLTRRQAAQKALDTYAQTGITGFTDKAGRNWNLASYAEMATRTMAGQAAVQGHVDTLAAHGHALVIASDAPQECARCRPWEGKVLAITVDGLGTHTATSPVTGQRVQVTVTATLAQATAAGFAHPNCRHSVSAYQVGVTKPITDTEDPEGDRARQRQRLLERRVRAAKRQAAVALDPAAAQIAGKRVRARQAALRAHIAEHDLRRLPYREQITRAI